MFGAVGFLCLAVAAFAYSWWASPRGESGQARLGLWCGIVVVVGFVGGAALAQSAAGVTLLWLSVLAGLLWLALACAHLYTVVPHPLIAQRSPPES
ncbi:hypothetical protein [Microbacterium suwonense]|uniref:Uncharacterized protein n=1 Tax=Microbacterium suwonense TaxID=683047 RepID=A0ABM8FQX5_9MICO|nr:hypothetical protein [Microbacterium suwonense]BDZ37850.1 hypothetical protein GCM10025863_04640 [Microbacterium suwonense]